MVEITGTPARLLFLLLVVVAVAPQAYAFKTRSTAFWSERLWLARAADLLDLVLLVAEAVRGLRSRWILLSWRFWLLLLGGLLALLLVAVELDTSSTNLASTTAVFTFLIATAVLMVARAKSSTTRDGDGNLCVVHTPRPGWLLAIAVVASLSLLLLAGASDPVADGLFFAGLVEFARSFVAGTIGIAAWRAEAQDVP